MTLIPITEHDFRKKVKGCGIKYYNKVLKTQLKALLCYCPTRKPKTPVEISDEFGLSKVYDSITEAGADCGVPTSTVKFALDNEKPSFKRRSIVTVPHLL